MSMEQYLHNAEEDGESSGNEKNMSPGAGDGDPDSLCGFECNICLELVQDPVVTFCGHLYCWPCIYHWISNDGYNHLDEDPPNYQRKHPGCPVCKAEVSLKTIIPLYGRGSQTALPSRHGLSHHTPPRPSPSSALPSQIYHHPRNSMAGISSLSVGLSGSATHLMGPMVAMLGEIAYSRLFGRTSETAASLYASYDPNYYSYYDHHLGSSSSSSTSSDQRLRRHLMQTDESLNRVCFFLCCCAIMCLLLF